MNLSLVLLKFLESCQRESAVALHLDVIDDFTANSPAVRPEKGAGNTENLQSFAAFQVFPSTQTFI